MVLLSVVATKASRKPRFPPPATGSISPCSHSRPGMGPFELPPAPTAEIPCGSKPRGLRQQWNRKVYVKGKLVKVRVKYRTVLRTA